MTDRTRECKGCGGSGDRFYMLRGKPCWEGCPACLGSGTVTDGPYRRDAEVDAETLRLTGMLWDTQGWVSSAVVQDPRFPERAIACYRRAARAAFRAVPALRGEGE
jgi:hypothetical protein